MDKSLFDKLSKRIEGYENEIIEVQKKLISIPAIAPQSGGKGEFQKAKYLEPIIIKLFDKVTPCHTPYKDAEGGVRPNYACVLKGKDTSRTIWVMAHMDVVPEGDIKEWKTNPFEAVVKDGKIYGRGSEDNNQAIVSGYFAIKAFKDEGITPPYNLGLLLVSDEENGSKFGTQYLLENHKEIFGKNDMILVPDSGNAAGTEIEVAEKSVVRFKMMTKGKQGHAAMPKTGINAHRVAAHIITKLDELYKIYPEKNSTFLPEDTSTFEPTMKLQNLPNVNTIPGEDVVFYDCRLLPGLDPETFIAKAKNVAGECAKQFGASVDFEIVHISKAAAPTPSDHPLIIAIKNAAKAVYGVDAKAIGIGGNTVAQLFRREGFPCAVYARQDGTLHGPNEYCVIKNVIGDAKVWCHMFLQ